MTSIESQVTRRTRFPFAAYGQDRKRIVVTLHPVGGEGDFITLRLERRRQGYTMDLCDLYALMVRNEVNKRKMEKLRKRKKSVKRFIRLTA